MGAYHLVAVLAGVVARRIVSDRRLAVSALIFRFADRLRNNQPRYPHEEPKPKRNNRKRKVDSKPVLKARPLWLTCLLAFITCKVSAAHLLGCQPQLYAVQVSKP